MTSPRRSRRPCPHLSADICHHHPGADAAPSPSDEVLGHDVVHGAVVADRLRADRPLGMGGGFLGDWACSTSPAAPGAHQRWWPAWSAPCDGQAQGLRQPRTGAHTSSMRDRCLAVWVGGSASNAGSAVGASGNAGMAMAVTQFATAAALLSWCCGVGDARQAVGAGPISGAAPAWSRSSRLGLRQSMGSLVIASSRLVCSGAPPARRRWLRRFARRLRVHARRLRRRILTAGSHRGDRGRGKKGLSTATPARCDQLWGSLVASPGAPSHLITSRCVDA